VSQIRIEGGGNDQDHIDARYMRFDQLVSNASLYMPAMHLMHVPQPLDGDGKRRRVAEVAGILWQPA
jgi:hypothetical protein